MKIRRVFVALVVLGLFSMACGGGDLITPSPVVESPTDAPQKAAMPEVPIDAPATPALQDIPAGSDEGDAAVTVSNYSGVEACYVYISPSTSDSWGENRLDAGETIPDGASRQFSVTPDTYDVRVEDCDEEPLYEEGGFVVEGNVEVLVGGGRGGARDSATLTANNTLDVEICSLFVALSNGTSWGANRLGAGETVLPGYELTLFLSPGEYSVKALDCYGEELSEWHYIPVASETAFDLESGMYDAAGDPADETGGMVTLQMVNRTAGDICYVNIVASTATEWGADLLGSEEVVSPGAQRDFQLELGSYHMQALDCKGNAVSDLRNVALSEDLTWTLGDVAAQSTTQPTAQPATSTGAPYQVTIRLYNDSDETIRFIQVEDECDFVDGYISDEYPYEARRRKFALLEPGDEILPHELRYFHLDMGPFDVCRKEGGMLGLDGGVVKLTATDADSLEGLWYDDWVRSVSFEYRTDGQMFCQDVFFDWTDKNFTPCESLQVGPEIYWYPRMNSFSLPGMRVRAQNFTGKNIFALEFGSVLEMDEVKACYEGGCFEGWVKCGGSRREDGTFRSIEDLNPRADFPWRAGDVCIFDVSGGGTGSYEFRAWSEWNVDTCNTECCFLGWAEGVNAFTDEIYKFTVHQGYDVDKCGGMRPEDVP